MDIQDKNKEQLIIELQELQQKYDSLKDVFEKDIAKRKLAEEALRVSENLYHKVFDQANEGLILLTMDGKIAELNQSFAQMHGYTVDEMRNLDIRDIDVLKEDVFDRRAELMKRIFEGEVVRFEVEHYHKDGHTFLMSNTVSLITINEKQYFLAFHQDITERKQDEDKIREKDIQFRKLSSNVPDLIFQFTKRPDGSYCVPIASEGIWNIFGCLPEDVIDDFTPIGRVIHPDDAVRVISDIEYSAKHLTYFTCEFRVQIPGREVQWIFSRSSPEKLPDGSITWYGFNANITDRKKVEQELIAAKEKAEESARSLKHSQSLMQYIIEHNRSAIAVHDKNFKYIYYSQRYLTDYKIKETNIIGKHHYEVLPDIPQKWRDVHKKALAGEVLSAEEDSYLRDDGTLEWTRWECRPWYEADKTIGGFIIYTEVITQRKNMELELKAAKEKAEESDRLKSAFLANMSHEIRTPMNGILGFAALLKESDLKSEDKQEFIRIIERSGTRMLNIINDIVNLSKIESGQVDISFSNSNINDQIGYILSFFKPETERKNLQFSFKNKLSSKGVIIKTDREKLYAVLTNLVKNAIKFTSEGSIEIGCEKKGKYLEFYVKDTGVGISQEQKKFIFERFRQGSETLSRKYEGAGLGLSISKAYVEMLGGTIWLESEEGVGSTFYFTLPYNAEQEERTALQKDLTFDKTANHITKINILIAEDDEVSGILISINVKEFSKEIIKVRSGIEAVEACRNNPDIDLILMDVQMPEMGGYEATRQIRQFNKEVVIIAQTAFGLSGDRERAITAGCNDYIAKPINKEELVALIQKYF